MQVRNKRSMITVLFILMTGVFFTGCGFSYNYSFSTNKLKKADAMEFNVEKAVVEPITKIDIRTDTAEVELIPSDNYYVEINYLYWEDEPVYTLENGELKFDDRDALPDNYSINFNLDNSIKIYLPSKTDMSSLVIENSSGDVTVAGFQTDQLDITVSYGDFIMQEASASRAEITLSSGRSKISDSNIGSLDFTNSYGDANFTNINTGEPISTDEASTDTINITMSSGDIDVNGLYCNSIDITNSYGDITCEEVTATEFEMDLSSGNLDVTNSDLMDINLNNSYGDIDLLLVGSEDAYNLDLHTSYGSITVGSDKYEEEFIRENNGVRVVNADLSSGDFTLNFNDK